MKTEYTIFGESHGEAIGVVIENLPSGIEIDNDFILREMKRRQAKKGGLTTPRIESDVPEILSGVFEGKTTGTPLCAIIINDNTRSKDYEKDLLRPSHADYTGNVRYKGFNDYRGGGHFSGRLTAPLVFAGAVAKLILKKKGIYVGTHILQTGNVKDDKFDEKMLSKEYFEAIAKKDFAVINDEKGEEMKALIQKAREELTSVGGIIECAVIGMPVGVGSPDKDNLEGVISKNIFRVPAVKGIEFGLGFGFADAYGHEVNDEFCINDGKIETKTNNNGGILGGISNGMPIVFKTVIKPTPSIAREQNTVDISDMTETKIVIKGRHDPCILSRASVVIESAAALSVLEALK